MLAYATHDVSSAFGSIDHDFYVGVAHRANEAVNSLSDLTHVLAPESLYGRVQAVFHGVGANEISSLKGSVGEAILVHHLNDAGVNVTWGAHNQPDWDLILGGHEVNAKMYSDVWDLSKHLTAHPDIPVFVPGDIAHLPVDAVHFDSLTTAGVEHAYAALASGGHEIFADACRRNWHHRVRALIDEILGNSAIALRFVSSSMRV
jgi:hypothetical protein